MADPRVNKLRYRAWRRGVLEADLILGPFADRHLAAFSPSELDEFEALLDQPDPDIYAWITRQAPIPLLFDNDILKRIMDFQSYTGVVREFTARREH